MTYKVVASNSFVNRPYSVADRDIFIKSLDKNNRWVTLADEISWKILEEYYLTKSDFIYLHPDVSARTVIAAFIIKYRLKLSSHVTVQLISENLHLQYFAQAGKYYGYPPLTPELLRTIRDVFEKKEWSKFKNRILRDSHSTSFSKAVHYYKVNIKKTKVLASTFIKSLNTEKKVDTQLYHSAGIEPKQNDRRIEKSNARKKKKFKQKSQKVMSVIVWALLIGLVLGSMVMIVYESNWTFSKKKKTEKIK